MSVIGEICGGGEVAADYSPRMKHHFVERAFGILAHGISFVNNQKTYSSGVYIGIYTISFPKWSCKLMIRPFSASSVSFPCSKSA